MRIDNKTARRMLLRLNGLSDPAPGGRLSKADLLALIERLGFVQVDSINTLERAHHMILFSRRPGYRRSELAVLLERDRALFENWTHDAAIIPTRFYPYWRTRFEREAERLKERYRKWRRNGFETLFDDVLDHVREHGPVASRMLDDGGDKEAGAKESEEGPGWWNWKPSKTALEYLWRTGALAVCHRDSFQKVYDLSERVIPDEHREASPSEAELVDWACSNALDRLGAATSGELAAFWDGITPAEAKAWVGERLGRELIEVEIESADGGKPRKAVARPDLLEGLDDAEPPGKIRTLSPFDPMIRDRARTERVFGYHYRIEVFTPAPKRRYGYYVFPLLEGDRLIGRIDMKRDRDADALTVSGLWLEPGVKPGAGRLKRLESELDRVRRFAALGKVSFEDGWLRE